MILTHLQRTGQDRSICGANIIETFHYDEVELGADTFCSRCVIGLIGSDQHLTKPCVTRLTDIGG